MASTTSHDLTERIAEGNYRWLLTPKERSHIASLLNCDINRITLHGNIMEQDRQQCANCGKHSGLNDLVDNAMAKGVHSPDFMLGVLGEWPEEQEPRPRGGLLWVRYPV
ncbi:hypothetical protein BDW74DRAFT_183280 [Aspergillus multicolor]|uniref:uncharacterized protein n=1 Tax=Aspergillus multicolor TaxID=41759 RepID=UPI003CCD7611